MQGFGFKLVDGEIEFLITPQGPGDYPYVTERLRRRMLVDAASGLAGGLGYLAAGFEGLASFWPWKRAEARDSITQGLSTLSLAAVDLFAYAESARRNAAKADHEARVAKFGKDDGVTGDGTGDSTTTRIPDPLEAFQRAAAARDTDFTRSLIDAALEWRTADLADMTGVDHEAVPKMLRLQSASDNLRAVIAERFPEPDDEDPFAPGAVEEAADATLGRA